MTFGEKLREARVAKGLTQNELGGGKYSTSYVSLLERAQRQPTLAMTRHFADILGIEPDTVAQWIGSPEPDSGGLSAAVLHATSAANLKDHALAASEAEYAASLAKEQMNTAVWWNMTAVQAEAYLALGRFDEAVATLEELLEHPTTLAQPELHATALVRLSAIKRATGDLEDAIALARAATGVSRSLPEHSATRLECGYVLVAALAVRGNLDEAWQHASDLALVDQFPEVPSLSIGRAAWVVGNVAFRRGDVETGLKQHRLAAEHITPQADIGMWAQFNRASASRRLAAGISDEDVEQCIENAVLGLRIAGTAEEHLELALTRAHLHSSRGEFEAAKPLLFEVQEKAAGLEFEAAGLLELLLGRYYANVEDLEAARTHYMKAAKLYSDASASDVASHVLGELMDIAS
ncbi:helix-turn-helix domain-containing protein [uncultured Arthrobacter sp.]|uniref:helix-turn-helix domain-containing protein n=1 Tax=uncultured Arthrobacter sp. TaxID=114050 RepID=UPI00262FD617|nr:helix-turn-helix transcriptional regulator [uncultured Arthrobacter sp.]